MPAEARQEHAAFCFRVIEAALRGKTPPLKEAKAWTEECPLFVTWNKWSKKYGEYVLRGCIGTFSSLPLSEALAQYAEISAFEDSRFRPIDAGEVPQLECCVSLLTKFEKCRNYMDWDLGTHGIYVMLPNPDVYDLGLVRAAPSPGYKASVSEFEPIFENLDKVPRKSRMSRAVFSATYLPEVMPEQGWTKEEAFESVLRKSGYRGPVTPQVCAAVVVIRYESSKVSLTYAEYKDGGLRM